MNTTNGLQKTNVALTLTLSETQRKMLAIEATAKRIKFYNENDIAFLSDKIVWWQRVLGVTSPLSVHESDDLIRIFQEFYPELSWESIELAIMLAALRKLDLDKNEHYNQFGIHYLGNVLAAYDAKVSEARYIDMRIKAKEEPTKLLNAQYADLSPDVIMDCYNRWLRTGEIIDVGGTVYIALERAGVFKAKNKKAAPIKNNNTITSALEELSGTVEISATRRGILVNFFQQCKAKNTDPLHYKK